MASRAAEKKEEIEQLRIGQWDTQTARPASGNTESVVPPDKEIEQKENPSIAIDRLSNNLNASSVKTSLKVSNSLRIALHP